MCYYETQYGTALEEVGKYQDSWIVINCIQLLLAEMEKENGNMIKSVPIL
jgi:hypothetical protein